MIEIGDRRPLLYFHGFTPRAKAMNKPYSMGSATASKIDKQGLWMRAELPPKGNDELADRTWEAALKGTARASTGSVNYLERHDSTTGEVLCWPIAELSVFDGGEERVPVSDDAIVLPLRALFEEQGITLPEHFEAGEDKESEADNQQNIDKRSINMDDIQKAVAEALAQREAQEAAKKAEKEAMRAEILEEIQGEPKYRSTFNIGGEATAKNGKFSFRKLMSPQEKEQYDKAELEEADYAMFNLMNPTQAPHAMRVLEETEAAEGAGLIPTPMLNRIIGLRDEVSLPRRMGVPVYQTDSLTLSIPREDSGMAVFATVAEEGAYIANEPAFSAETVTVAKKGSLITATEELLADSSLFEPYFTSLCGRKWGLTENLIFFTEAKADDTAGTHSATFTQAEIDAFMFQITEPWATGAWLIMNWATMGVIRGLLIATPRAYGDFPNFGGLDYPSMFGYRTACDSNWEDIGGGDTKLTMSLINPQAMSWVERQGLQIFVDPYGDSLNGRVRYMPRFRAACATTQVLGNVSYTDHA
jgi:HK97 family phage major capsid protein